MIYTYATLEAVIEEMILHYREKAERDPEYLLLDQDSYAILKEELLSDLEHYEFMDIDFYRGMRVFYNDVGRTYLRLL